jgi:carboxyl-terminal processing protease
MTSAGARNALIGVIAAFIGVLLVALGFLGHLVLDSDDGATTVAGSAATPAPAVASVSDEANFQLLNEIFTVLTEDYVEPDKVDAEYLREGAINGLFEALADPHSAYIDPETYSISRDDFSGTFQGIGATVSQQDRYVIIVRPLPGTPAEAAGLQAGDIILAVDGESAEGWSVPKAVQRIRGPRGTEVTLKVRHADGTEEDVTIVRDEILVSSVRAEPPGGVLRDADGNVVDDLSYVQIRSFTRLTPQELQEAVQAAEANGSKGLILDVRSNPGGLLAETTQIADMFLDEGTILVQVDRQGTERVANATPGSITDLPIVVLQDEFSASGSELLAAALQENGRAKVVGSKSFGKGTVNHVRELSNGGAVYVSIARWLTPDRNQIEGRGIIPDVEVTLTLEDIEQERDVALFRSIEVLREQISGGTRTAVPAS